MKLTVETPEGDYCEDCKFMEHYDYPLVDMMGNETGNRRSGYKCRYFNDELKIEDFRCYQKVKKCFWCTASKEEKAAMAIGWMLLFGGFDKRKDAKE